MNSYDAIRSGRVIVNGLELAGTVFQPTGSSFRTIFDKTRIVNYSNTAFYIAMGIIRQGQGVKFLERLFIRAMPINPHQTIIIEELKGEVMDFPSELFADVTSAGGAPAQFGNVSITITGTQKRN